MLIYKADEEFQSGAMVALKTICDNRDEQIHNHDFVEIVYVIEGSGRQFVNGEEFSVKAGDLLFVNYGCTHAFFVDEKLVAYNLMVRVDYFTKNMIKDDNLFYMLALTSFEKIQRELNDKTPLIYFDYNERDDIIRLFKNMKEYLLLSIKEQIY